MDFVKLAAVLTVLEKARYLPNLEHEVRAHAQKELDNILDEGRDKTRQDAQKTRHG